jgi:rhamnosyltransferase subunit B
MNYQLLTIGSHGDVHPFVGLAQTLQQRGHRVCLATNASFESLVVNAGVEFVPIGTPEQFNRWIENPDVWHPRKGGGAVLRGASETLPITYELARDFDGVTIASTLAILGAVNARETHQRKVISAHLAPICARSVYELPRLPIPIDLNFLPMLMRQHFWNGADRFSIDPAIAPQINALRKQIGLPPASSILGSFMHSPDLSVGLWPDWFAKPQPDWPTSLKLTGFPLYDEADVTPLPDDLRAFLDAGSPPVAFTPGSAMKFGQAFFRTAADACERIQTRGLLLTRHAEQIPQSLPKGVIHVAYAPFGKLLPQCAAVVHHGGIGTTSQALLAGCPQLIMPMSHDQPDNATRVKKLGCGDWLWPSQFKPARVAKMLSTVMSQEVKQTAGSIARRMAGDHRSALNLTCDLIESVK